MNEKATSNSFVPGSPSVVNHQSSIAVHQTLFYIPREIFDVPVFGFGWLLAVWVLFSLALLAWLGWHQGFGASARTYLPILMLVAAIIWWLLPELCESRGLSIRGYGVMTVVGFIAATGLAAWRARRAGLDPDLMLSLAFWVLVPGIVGARLFYVIEYWPTHYSPVYEQEGLAAMLRAVVNVPQGGQVVYGSFLGAALGMLAFVRRYRLPLLATCDLVAPSLMLGLALGRIGCLLNGCCYGGICDLPWAVTFPPDSPAHFHQVAHGQTFIYGLKITADAKGRPLIREVEAGSAAEQQGLKPGQRIARINGREVPTVNKAAASLLGANKISIAVKQSRYVAQWTIDCPPAGNRPSSDAVDLEKIKQGQTFIHGLKITANSQGQPVIAEVEPGSAAEEHGLKPGQQITGIDGLAVETVDDVARALLGAGRISIATVTEAGERVSRWTLTRPPPGSRPVQPVHPTQIYSSINALLLCLLLLACAPFCRRDGELFALLMSTYPITRFLLEMIRTDESPVFHTGLSISQNLSLGLLICAAGLWFYILRRPPRHGQSDAG